MRAVLYALLHTDNFKDCLITVINQGGDADTTGALAGMLAGGLYGTYGLPAAWLQRLDPAVQKEIAGQVDQLLTRNERADHTRLPSDLLLIQRPLMEAEGAKTVGFSEDQLRLWTSISLDVYAENTGVATDLCRRSVPCPNVRQVRGLT